MSEAMKKLKIEPRIFSETNRFFDITFHLDDATNLLQPFFTISGVSCECESMEVLKLEFEFTSKIGFGLILGYSEIYSKQGFFEKVIETLEDCLNVMKEYKEKTLIILPELHEKEPGEILVKEVFFIMTDTDKTLIKVLSSVEF